jgi:formylglycine-generating enzyme required for sulfatase activity
MGKKTTGYEILRCFFLLILILSGLVSIIGTGGGGGGGDHDDEVLVTYYRDGDADGYGDINATLEAASLPQGYVTDNTDCNDADAAINPGGAEACGDNIDNDCDTQIDEGCQVPACTDADGDGYYAEGGCGTVVDCNDTDAAISPGVAEVCNDSIDNDCDGRIDEDCAPPTCTDADKDGFHAESGCDNAFYQGVDCDDTNREINPYADEVCGDGKDNDCDGEVDEGCSGTACTDTDGDGYYAQDGCGTAVDCDDADAAVHPQGAEVCNDGVDNDCDGQVDEGCSGTACTDADGDGYYAEAGCGNAFLQGTDCDDTDPDVYPGAAEICKDGLDNDCDGQIDENCSGTTCTDADKDGYYVEAGCGNAFVDGIDCDDNNAAIHPDAAEICGDRKDNDCDGQVDENCSGTCTDADKDGYYVEAGCGNVFVDGIDCDDNNAAIHPDAAEICGDRKDNDCDGQVDENCATGSFTNSLGMTFKRIPAGTFIMGIDSGETPHQVRLTNDFYMQTTEVTQGQWRTVYGNNPSYFQFCGDNCPVEQVSWNVVQYFIAAMNRLGEGTYRLPTEAEWEYACRAGSATAFANGPMSQLYCGYDPNLNAMGWYCYNSAVTYNGCENISSYAGPVCAGPHPVGRKSPNAWGLYDMHGNVWEWVADRYSAYPSTSVVNPTGPTTGTARIYRGGGWHNAAMDCTSAIRHSS